MRVYEPISSTHKLNKGETRTELDLHCDLYSKLKSDGFSVLSGRTYLKKYVFDIVVFDKKGKAKTIIEVKREDNGHRVALDQTEQGFKYRHFGVPLVLFWDMKFYEDLKKFLETGDADLSLSGEDLRIETSKKEFPLRRLQDLRRRLDTAAMAAFDAGVYFPEVKNMETELEKFRDQVDEKYRSL